LIPLSVAAVVQIHALWCALSLPPRLRRCCHQSRPTAQLAADRAVEKPCPTRSNLRANTQSPNRANVVRLLASHGQAGTYPSIRQISTHKRPSVLQTAGSFGVGSSESDPELQNLEFEIANIKNPRLRFSAGPFSGVASPHPPAPCATVLRYWRVAGGGGMRTTERAGCATVIRETAIVQC